jgi:hypothetical protein
MHRYPSAVVTLLASVLWAASAHASDVVVVRVGDGGSALGTTAAPVYLDRFAADGTPGTMIALPTAASGPNFQFALSGTGTTEGALAVSSDGNYLTLAGYVALPGADPTTAARVVARVDAQGDVDTTTTLSNAFASGIRGAVTIDGSAFWICGTGGSSGNGGVWRELLGLNGGTQLMSSPGSVRVVNIFSGQLYGSSGAGGFASVVTIGNGTPDSIGLTATVPPGLPTSGASPYGFLFFDRGPVAGLDTLYVADDRAAGSGGGIQKWTFNGSTWTLQATFTNGISTGVRGLAGEVVGGRVVLYATTTQAGQNTLVRVVDDGTTTPAISVIATAAANTVYRGVAMAWVPPMVDVVFSDGFE